MSESSVSSESPVTFHPTGIRAIDRLLGGKGWAVPSVVLLEGMAGVGKTRLLRRLFDTDRCEYETVSKARFSAEKIGPSGLTTFVTRTKRDMNARHDADVVLTLTRNARKNRLELRCEDKNRFGRVDPDLFVAFDENHEKFTLMRTKRKSKTAGVGSVEASVERNERVMSTSSTTPAQHPLPTPAEIVARIAERKKEDFFGFETTDYIVYLSFVDAKQFLGNTDKDPTIEADWETTPLIRESILKEMHDYMEFAWGKANDERGLSASRSVSHYIAWTWLAGDRELSAWVGDSNNYEFYGKPILEKICEHYGWNSKQWDDGRRSNGGG